MKRFLLFLIRFYRRELSHRKRKPSCRYIPTCSEYAVTAIERYGAWKGGRLIRAGNRGKRMGLQKQIQNEMEKISKIILTLGYYLQLKELLLIITPVK